MSFRVIDGPVYERWYPVDDIDTLYVGQLVQTEWASITAAGDGVVPFGSAAGFANFTNTGTNKTVPLGIVAGTNRTDDLFDSTYKANSIVGGTNTGAVTAAEQAAVAKSLVEGQLGAAGDVEAKVLVGVITPSTLIRGAIFQTSYGTALTPSTVTSASSDGGLSAVTASAADAASFEVGVSTIYCRSGNNAGVYRTGINTSKTAQQVDHAFPNAAIAVGDVLVQVPLKLGLSKIQFQATESMYVDGAGVYTTHYAYANIVEINLREAGKEYVDFMFTAQNWVTDIVAS